MSNAVNYDDVFLQLKAAGLIVGDYMDIGRMRRCRVEGERERKGWYALHEVLQDDGVTILVGSYGIWQGADPNTQKITISKRKLSRDQQVALKARIAEDKRRTEAQRKKEQEKAARIAEAAWNTCTPNGSSEYLERKNVQSYGLRFTDSGALAIPVLDGFGRIHGLQFILPADHPRRKKFKIEKEFWPKGMAMSGNYFMIGTPVDVVLICEGYATGATLHEATGLPVVVAFNANNLLPVAQAIRKRYQSTQILICADDDYLVKCHAKTKNNGNKCGTYNRVGSNECRVCASHMNPKDGRAGVTSASAAALAVGGAWMAPVFADERGVDVKGPTDFNDLANHEGLHLVRSQVEAKLREAEWLANKLAALVETGGAGNPLKPLLNVPEAVDRYSLIYGAGGTMYDHQEYELIPKSDVLDICVDHAWREWKLHIERKVVRLKEVGFDPTQSKPDIKCNLFGGWPTKPKQGDCTTLLELLQYLCRDEEDDRATQAIYHWVLKWLAYPIQHPGAKMKTALIFHGPQGVGKNMFFENYAKIFGQYGSVVGQAEIDDKFNDWASAQLFMIADEVMARAELFHNKNKIKTLITGETIRINPKNVAAHKESNHVNLVFLSNDKQPLVLEKDDRRFVVVWVPEKLPKKFYEELSDEVAAGGVEALHYHLLNLDLGDFKENTDPPMTQSKVDLIDINMDSIERFIKDWMAGETPYPFCPCQSMDLYQAYRRWCNTNGAKNPRESNQFLGHFNKMPGWTNQARHVHIDTTHTGATSPKRMIIPSESTLASTDYAKPAGASQAAWLTDCFFEFRNRLDDEGRR